MAFGHACFGGPAARVRQIIRASDDRLAVSEQSLRPVVLEVIDLFGPERCMIGSNFPVDGLFSSYTRLIQAYWSITQNLSDTEREAIFVGNAARFYSIDIG